MKTHFKKMKNPNYVGSWDLMDENGNVLNKTVTITKVVKEVVFDGTGKSEECPVVYLKECKPMVANSTNLKKISKLLNSPFIEDWSGKQIILTVKKIKAFGEFHDAIRVADELPKAAPAQSQKLELKAGTPEFENVKAGLKNGFTMEQVEKKYIVSEQIKKLLNETV